MKTEKIIHEDAGGAAPPRIEDDPKAACFISAASGTRWISIIVGDRRTYWPANAVSESNDWEAAY